MFKAGSPLFLSLVSAFFIVVSIPVCGMWVTVLVDL
jgi:hypothetical protein